MARNKSVDYWHNDRIVNTFKCRAEQDGVRMAPDAIKMDDGRCIRFAASKLDEALRNKYGSSSHGQLYETFSAFMIKESSCAFVWNGDLHDGFRVPFSVYKIFYKHVVSLIAHLKTISPVIARSDTFRGVTMSMGAFLRAIADCVYYDMHWTYDEARPLLKAMFDQGAFGTLSPYRVNSTLSVVEKHSRGPQPLSTRKDERSRSGPDHYSWLRLCVSTRRNKKGAGLRHLEHDARQHIDHRGDEVRLQHRLITDTLGIVDAEDQMDCSRWPTLLDAMSVRGKPPSLLAVAEEQFAWAKNELDFVRNPLSIARGLYRLYFPFSRRDAIEEVLRRSMLAEHVRIVRTIHPDSLSSAYSTGRKAALGLLAESADVDPAVIDLIQFIKTHLR